MREGMGRAEKSAGPATYRTALNRSMATGIREGCAQSLAREALATSAALLANLKIIYARFAAGPVTRGRRSCATVASGSAGALISSMRCAMRGSCSRLRGRRGDLDHRLMHDRIGTVARNSAA